MQRLSRKYRPPKKRVNPKLKSVRANAAAARWQEHNKPTTPLRPTSDEDELSSDESDLAQDQETPTSSRKINYFRNLDFGDIESKEDDEYIIVHKGTLNQLFQTWPCKKCGECSVQTKICDKQGFACKIIATCSHCNETCGEAYSSQRLHNETSSRPPFQINKRMTDAFLDIGAGYAAMQRFGMCTGINVLSPRAWQMHVKKIKSENQNYKAQVLERSRQKVREVHGVTDSEEVINIAVSFDGTWHRRGHLSLNGVGIVIDILSGLVIDYEVLSKFCLMCAIKSAEFGETSKEYLDWFKVHKEMNECQNNFEGSSGSMEMKSAEIIWKRSERDCKLRYTTLLSDGDAKTFTHLTKENIYGPDVILTKEECVNHVAKRMGTGLRNIVKEWKGKGVALGGKGEGTLKDTTINQLTNYYRNAIVSNMPNTQKMKMGILATLDHCSSTDKKPKHSKCPKGKDSWCFFNKAKALKQKPKAHKDMSLKLSDDVVKKIKPIYDRLSNDELLKRCAKGGTQNSNESLHSLIWRRCPKEVYASKNRVELAVARAVSEFNMGCLTSLQLRKEVAGEDMTQAEVLIAEERDKKREQKSALQRDATMKRVRKKTKAKKIAVEAKKRKVEGDTYKAGHFDV